MSTTPTHAPETDARTADVLISRLAARLTVPRYDDIAERHADLYAELCDAVAPAQDHTTTEDFCEHCQPAYLRVDEERNAELVARERMAFRLGVEVGRQDRGKKTGGSVAIPPVSRTDDSPDTDDAPDVGACFVNCW